MRTKPAVNIPKKVSIKERLGALKNLPAFFKLVWEAAPGMMAANMGLRFVKAAIPFLLLYTGKLIIDKVLHLSQHQDASAQYNLWVLVAIEFGLALLSDGLTRAITLLDSLLGDLFSNH